MHFLNKYVSVWDRARLMHREWVLHVRREGWKPGPSLDKQKMQDPRLVTWEKLTNEQQKEFCDAVSFKPKTKDLN